MLTSHVHNRCDLYQTMTILEFEHVYATRFILHYALTVCLSFVITDNTVVHGDRSSILEGFRRSEEESRRVLSVRYLMKNSAV